MKKSSSITTFDEHLEKRYGKAGEEGRMAFEAKAKAFAIGELIKEERRLSKMTQEQLAIKTGTKKVLSPGLKMEKVIFSFLPFL